MLYIVWHQPDREIEQELLFSLDRFELKPGLLLVDSELNRSKLYHKVKRALPKGSPLFVGGLDEAPKFKGMEEGAVKWMRARD